LPNCRPPLILPEVGFALFVAYYDSALAGFPIQDVVQIFQLLDRLKDGLARIADPEGD
jgi:hypothetical protein